MSLEKLKTAAAKHNDDYVTLPAGEMAEALKQGGGDVADELLRHVVSKAAANDPAKLVSIHRTHHIARLQAVAAPAIEAAPQAVPAPAVEQKAAATS